MKQHTLWIGPAVAVAIFAGLLLSGSTSAVAWTTGITVWCAVWWVFEPIPIPATSLIPLALFPLVGVLEPAQVGQAYGDKLILLLLGGLMLSSAMERSGAHRRIALTMVSLFGGASARRLVFGFMAAAAGLSMWISNMATTLMLLPVVLAVLEGVEDRNLRISLLLGTAYAASVGGVGTPVGTPPNLIFMNSYQVTTGTEPAFTDWMSWALPIVLVMLPLMALWLTRKLSHKAALQLPEVGCWRPEEVRTMAVFAVTAVLWITRREPFGGWSSWLGLPNANDASVALAAVVVMFLIPNTRITGGKKERLLDWETAAKIPWGILILFGSGITISRAFESSGLSASLGNSMANIGQLPPLLMIALVCAAVTFLTEVTSNTATANLLMPVLAAASVAADIDPKLIMVPATISASFAFMLPVATGPNAIVFGSNQVTIRDMSREGFALNLIGIAVVTVVCYWRFG
ncbi:MAG: SLC13 family permease [Planctomycetota bacterium]